MQVVIESAVDKRNGILANVLVRSGELKVGDSFVIGTEYGKVRHHASCVVRQRADILLLCFFSVFFFFRLG